MKFLTTTIFSKTFFKSWILFQKDNIEECKCICSYCKDLENHAEYSFGFWTPKDKSYNSWWVLWFVGKQNNYYLRFTLPFLKKSN